MWTWRLQTVYNHVSTICSMQYIICNYSWKIANIRSGVFQLPLPNFIYPLHTPLSKTWHDGKYILQGLCWKGNPGISHSGLFTAQRDCLASSKQKTCHILLSFFTLTECQMWSVFKWYPAFVHLSMILVTIWEVVPNCSVQNVVWLKGNCNRSRNAAIIL